MEGSLKEHLACSRYVSSGANAVFKVFRYPKEERLPNGSVVYSSLFFVLDGSVCLVDDAFSEQVVPAGVVKVVDSEGDRLRYALECGVDLVKPNAEELERTLGIRIKNRETALEGALTLVGMGAKKVLLSLGKEGAIITDGNRHFYCKTHNVAMNSTVAAGDAMVAAAMSALVRGADLQTILKCGVAAGTAAVTQPDTISFTKDKYDEIFSSLFIKEI